MQDSTKQYGTEEQQLLKCLVHNQALRLGQFTLKSGRRSPYFIDLGVASQGACMKELADAYAAVIARDFPGVRIVYGPAYKGIPLAALTALALQDIHDKRRTAASAEDDHPSIRYLFNRKETKTHGEGGVFVGVPPKPGEQLVIVDDVITDAATKREAVQQLRAHWPHVEIKGLVIAFDRAEPSAGASSDDRRSAAEVFAAEHGIPVRSLLNLDQLIQHLPSLDFLSSSDLPSSDSPDVLLQQAAVHVERLKEYRRKYAA